MNNKKKYTAIAFRSSRLVVTFYRFHTDTEKQTRVFAVENSTSHRIIYCLVDDMSCLMGGKTRKLKKGDIILIRPGEKIEIYTNANFNKIDTKFYVRNSKAHLLEVYINDKLFENDVDVNVFFRAFNEREKYKNNFYQADDFFPLGFFDNCALLFAEYIKNNLDIFPFKTLVATMIAQLNLNFDKTQNYTPVKYSKEYELKIYDYILRNFNKDISIKHLSEKFFVSKVYINKVTNKFYGMNFNDTIKSIRLWEATNLMKRSIELSEISLLCGYKNYSTFYRNFVDRFGVTPAEKKKEILNSKET